MRNCRGRKQRRKRDFGCQAAPLPQPLMTTTKEAPPFRRAVVLVTLSSFLVPAAGVLTQPILARALGVQGRGEMAVALAAPGLALAVATLGLPEALVYHLAKRPSITRPALLLASLIAFALGVACLVASYLATPLSLIHI